LDQTDQLNGIIKTKYQFNLKISAKLRYISLGVDASLQKRFPV